MDNQNTDNKIQQNEAQQPENATAQPTAEQGAEQTEQKQPTSYAVRPQHRRLRPLAYSDQNNMLKVRNYQHRLHAARHRGGNTLDPAGRKPQYRLHRTHRGCSAQDCRSMYPTI